MCFNKEVSVIAFVIAVISQLALIGFGNKEYRTTNIQLAIIFFWVSLMQIIEYLIWIDLECKKQIGTNKLAGMVGPMLNYLQPLIYFIVLGGTKFGNISFINIVYLLVFVIYYLMYLSRDRLCSKEGKKGHLSWAWSSSTPPSKNSLNINRYMCYIYLGMVLMNVVLFDDRYKFTGYIITAILLLLSNIYYQTNVGELWCFFVVFIPLIILILQKIGF